MKNKNYVFIIGTVVVAIAAIAGLFLWSGRTPSSNTDTTSISTGNTEQNEQGAANLSAGNAGQPELETVNISASFWHLGEAGAPIVIDGYFDFT